MKKNVFCLFFVSFIACICGCKGFMSGNDVLEELEKSIDYVNAPETSVRIQLSTGSKGTTFPNGDVNQKVGYQFEINYEDDGSCVFDKWIAEDEQGNPLDSSSVVIDNVYSPKTNVIIKTIKFKVIIKAVSTEKLSYKSINTISKDTSDVFPCDKSPIIIMNYPLSKNVDLTKIEVTVNNQIINFDENSYFKAPCFGKNDKGEEDRTIINIPVNIQKLIKIPDNETFKVTIKLPANFYYEIDEQRKLYIGDEGISWSYYINSKLGSYNLPEIDSVYVNGTKINDIFTKTGYEWSSPVSFVFNKKLLKYSIGIFNNNNRNEDMSDCFKIICDKGSKTTTITLKPTPNIKKNVTGTGDLFDFYFVFSDILDEDGLKFSGETEWVYRINDKYEKNAPVISVKGYNSLNEEIPQEVYFSAIKKFDTKNEKGEYYELSGEEDIKVIVDDVFFPEYDYHRERNRPNVFSPDTDSIVSKGDYPDIFFIRDEYNNNIGKLVTGNKIQLNLTVNDDEKGCGIQKILIDEVFILTVDGTVCSEKIETLEITNEEEIQKFSNGNALNYTIKTQKNGVVRLDVKAIDNAGNEAVKPFYVYLLQNSSLNLFDQHLAGWVKDWTENVSGKMSNTNFYTDSTEESYVQGLYGDWTKEYFHLANTNEVVLDADFFGKIELLTVLGNTAYTKPWTVYKNIDYQIQYKEGIDGQLKNAEEFTKQVTAFKWVEGFKLYTNFEEDGKKTKKYVKIPRENPSKDLYIIYTYKDIITNENKTITRIVPGKVNVSHVEYNSSEKTLKFDISNLSILNNSPDLTKDCLVFYQLVSKTNPEKSVYYTVSNLLKNDKFNVDAGFIKEGSICSTSNFGTGNKVIFHFIPYNKYLDSQYFGAETIFELNADNLASSTAAANQAGFPTDFNYTVEPMELSKGTRTIKIEFPEDISWYSPENYLYGIKYWNDTETASGSNHYIQLNIDFSKKTPVAFAEIESGYTYSICLYKQDITSFDITYYSNKIKDSIDLTEDNIPPKFKDCTDFENAYQYIQYPDYIYFTNFAKGFDFTPVDNSDEIFDMEGEHKIFYYIVRNNTDELVTEYLSQEEIDHLEQVNKDEYGSTNAIIFYEEDTTMKIPISNLEEGYYNLIVQLKDNRLKDIPYADAACEEDHDPNKAVYYIPFSTYKNNEITTVNVYSGGIIMNNTGCITKIDVLNDNNLWTYNTVIGIDGVNYSSVVKDLSDANKKFLRICSVLNKGDGKIGSINYYNYICPEWEMDKPTLQIKNAIKAANGYIIYCDAPVFVHIVGHNTIPDYTKLPTNLDPKKNEETRIACWESTSMLNSFGSTDFACQVIMPAEGDPETNPTGYKESVRTYNMPEESSLKYYNKSTGKSEFFKYYEVIAHFADGTAMVIDTLEY